MGTFLQGDHITEIIIPLMITEFDKQSSKLSPPNELIGTGFLIGTRGFALTAAHVIDQLVEAKGAKDVISTHLQGSYGLKPFFITNFEKHPKEDIGIIQLDNSSLKSWLHICKDRHYHSAQYTAWGFPRENAEELKAIRENAAIFPDLIYTEGYVRRIIHHELRSSLFIGDRFYEVSDLGGSGYSGSPVIEKKTVNAPIWQVIGVYIGEKEGQGAPVGYVVPSTSFLDWIPQILGCSLQEESIKGHHGLFPSKTL